MAYKRRNSSVVFIGNTPMGGENPIRIQSMTNTSTMDTQSSVAQCIRIIEAGGEYVRLTAQGVREAENLRNIEDELHALNYHTPLVADIHFNPKAAEAAAKVVEKVRINPGNFADPIKTFRTFEYSDEEYQQELEKIKERFIPFLEICKEHNTAIRIGVNHGSLSDRIMSRYGDTPEGMVASCMEFLRICVAENFENIVISIKASSTFVMVRTVRLLVKQMDQEGMRFPLHLGVTEAGDGEDGRIKSAVGIGTLLLEGIGDTIRVSLSEDPEAEIPVAQKLLDYIRTKEELPAIHFELSDLDLVNPERRKTHTLDAIGGELVPVVISDYSQRANKSDESIIESFKQIADDLRPDYIYVGKQPLKIDKNYKQIVDYNSFSSAENCFPLFTMNEKEAWKNNVESLQFLRLSYSELDDETLNLLKEKTNTVLILSENANDIYAQKAFIHALINANISNPIIIQQTYNESDLETLQIQSATDCGSFFLDMLADGIMLSNFNSTISSQEMEACSFGILQASGRRITKTEYISCPSCGRTLFNLQEAIKKVKAATSHKKGLKIGIMGCIVNGPGEMADADYGYVGAGAGKVSLYKGKECVLKNIPEEEAVEKLLALMEATEKEK